MITDVVVHNGLEGVATGTFVCMVAYTEIGPLQLLDSPQDAEIFESK
jgi:hypothetical protein